MCMTKADLMQFHHVRRAGSGAAAALFHDLISGTLRAVRALLGTCVCGIIYK